jgi:hypothetical protein
MADLSKHLTCGAVAGFAATVPMTLFMLWRHKQLPKHLRYDLPPRLVTDAAARRLNPADTAISNRQKSVRAIAAHFGFGAACGALLPLIVGRKDPSILVGVTYGLAVCAGSYLGWIPALRLLKPATQHPASRVTMMLSAHAIWGVALVASLRLLRSRESSSGAMRGYVNQARRG